MNFRDNEIADDVDNTINKNACHVEQTITKLATTGFTNREKTLFEAQLQG